MRLVIFFLQNLNISQMKISLQKKNVQEIMWWAMRQYKQKQKVGKWQTKKSLINLCHNLFLQTNFITRFMSHHIFKSLDNFLFVFYRTVPDVFVHFQKNSFLREIIFLIEFSWWTLVNKYFKFILSNDDSLKRFLQFLKLSKYFVLWPHYDA